MNKIFNDEYAILDNTIISYAGQAGNCNIKASIDGAGIKRIGNAAFAGNQTIKQIVVEEGIEEIASFAFSQCKMLEKVVLPVGIKSIAQNAFIESYALNEVVITIPFGKESYDGVIKQAVRLEHRDELLLGRINRTFPEFELINSIIQSRSAMGKVVPLEQLAIFMQHGEISDELLNAQNTFVFEAAGINDELQLAKLLCRRDEKGYFDNESERADEDRKRVQYEAKPEETALVFLEKEYKERGSERLVKVHIRFGYFYWGNVTKVRYAGKFYHIYFRYYLNGMCAGNYSKSCCMVINEHNEVLQDGEEKECVLGKYRLLQFL